MRVTIIDIEWFNKISFTPNVVCMKLSSYHKQLGDLINFPTNSFELNLKFDKMYIIRKSLGSKIPIELDIKNEKVFLLGEGFKFNSRYYDTNNNI